LDNDQEERIRELAYSLWQSAESPYWIALDYWLMAEQIVLEMTIATRKGVRRVRLPQKTQIPINPHSHREVPSSE